MNPKYQPPHDAISKRANEIWLAEGKPEGRALAGSDLLEMPWEHKRKISANP